MTSTRDLRKDFLTSLEINEKNYPFSSHLLEKMWEYEKLSQRSKRVKNLPQLVSLISPMLPRSRNCHLPGRVFVHGKVNSLIKKREKFKGQTKKIISL